MSIGEYLRGIVGSLVHRVPQCAVARARLDVHKRPARLEFIVLLRIEIESDRVAEVPILLRLRFADAPDGDHDARVGRVLVSLERVDVRDFLEQLGLGIGAASGEPRRSDLEMEVPEPVRGSVGLLELMPPLDE